MISVFDKLEEMFVKTAAIWFGTVFTGFVTVTLASLEPNGSVVATVRGLFKG
jgi:hypothetical protein